MSVGVESLSRHRGVIWALIATGLVLAIVLAGRWARPSDSAAPASTSETPRVDTAAPPEPQEPQKQPGVPSGTATETPAVAATPERPAIDPPARTPAPDKTSTAVTTAPSRSVPTVSLVESQLCRTLSNWRCTPAGNPAGPGVFIFYTRVRSARDTRVQHRWYLNGTLLQSVQLRVGANPGRGYRTYSRSTVNAERRGDWTIEVRDAGGALLHEERFVVR